MHISKGNGKKILGLFQPLVGKTRLQISHTFQDSSHNNLF